MGGWQKRIRNSRQDIFENRNEFFPKIQQLKPYNKYEANGSDDWNSNDLSKRFHDLLNDFFVEAIK